MPLRRGQPLKFVPGSLSDAIDGTNAPPGAMSRLDNLIPDPSTRGVFVPRPAAVQLTDFTGFTTPGTLSALLVVGDLAYGMIPSGLNPGQDQPFIYDLANDNFITVAGITVANTPASPPASGDWTPPIMAQVGSRILVCHPGFAGGASTPPWMQATRGTFTSGSPIVRGNPLIQGTVPFVIFSNIVVGQRIYSASTASNATIIAVDRVTVTTTCSGTTGTPTLTVASAAGIVIGQDVILPGAYLLAETTVTNIVGTTVTISNNLLDTVPAGTVVYFFDSTITMSANATASATEQVLWVTGGGSAINFGWFDISGFEQEVQGSTLAGLPVLIGNFSVLGVQPGMTMAGPGIVADTVALASTPIVHQQTVTMTSGSEELTFATLFGTPVGAIYGAAGMSITGAGIPAGTIIAGADAVGNITMSQAATASATVVVTITGAMIVMSTNATATADFVTVTIAGGTAAAPLWGAGDTDINPLPSKPLGVAQFNGRAYFACGEDGLPYSDSGFACRRSSGTQALTTNDGLAVTAVAQLLLTAPLTGGIVQALLAFEGTTKMQQIVGDPATANLTMNALPMATGTDAPLSIAPCEIGTAFISPQGLRVITPDGKVSPPVGDRGAGVTQPFQFAAAPSQICLAANVGVLRVTVQNALAERGPYQEYWYDLSRQIWTGPHSFPARLIQPWRSTFLVAPVGLPAELWQSDAFANNESSYEENGSDLTWVFQTVLLPDNELMAMNAIIESSFAVADTGDNVITVAALDEDGETLDEVTFTPSTLLWQRALEWTKPVIFKQMSVRASGQSDYTVHLGNLYLRYQILGYSVSAGLNVFLLNDDGVILSDDDALVDLLAPG